MIPSPETEARVALWRQKALDGTLTLEESREAITYLRQSRGVAAAASAKSRSVKSPIDGEALLDSLL